MSAPWWCLGDPTCGYIGGPSTPYNPYHSNYYDPFYTGLETIVNNNTVIMGNPVNSTIKCPNGTRPLNGRCVADSINTPVINLGLTPTVDIFANLKAAIAANPMVVLAAGAAVVYLVIKK